MKGLQKSKNLFTRLIAVANKQINFSQGLDPKKNTFHKVIGPEAGHGRPIEPSTGPLRVQPWQRQSTEKGIKAKAG
jgi:hypothetical protein